jgi:hypothetical protein
MPTTTTTDTTMAVSAVGSRTDSAGAGVTDYTAEEVRFSQQMWNPGYIEPINAFKVQAQTVPAMSVKVGSGTSKADYYLLQGTVAGQGNYVVRLDVSSVNVTISAADASQPRTDEIYLYVADTAYDSSSRVLPRLGYRKGDVGGAAPGPDSAWKAYAKLASVAVAAGATTITSANITDSREIATNKLGIAGWPLGSPRLFTTGGASAPSTTPVSAFTVPITATGRYLIEGFLHYAAAPARGMRMTWGVPSGATGRWSSGGIQIGVGGRIGDYDLGMVEQNVALPVSGDAGGPAVYVGARPVMHLDCPNTGTLTLSIGQDNGGAEVTTLWSNSILRVTRVSA